MSASRPWTRNQALATSNGAAPPSSRGGRRNAIILAIAVVTLLVTIINMFMLGAGACGLSCVDLPASRNHPQ